MKLNLNTFFSSATLALALVAPVVAAPIYTVSVGGVTKTAGEGLESSYLGATTQHFDGLTSLPAGFTATATMPSNPLVSGNLNNVYAAPTGDASTYLTSGKGTISDTLAAGTVYFGFYWGSVDDYNTLTLHLSNGQTSTFTGDQLDQLNNVDVNHSNSYFVNFSMNTPGVFIKSVDFSSSNYSFELDNVASATPEPASMAMLAGGLLAVAGLVRRRKA